jgi:hypothetical protein
MPAADRSSTKLCIERQYFLDLYTRYSKMADESVDVGIGDVAAFLLYASQARQYER